MTILSACAWLRSTCLRWTDQRHESDDSDDGPVRLSFLTLRVPTMLAITPWIKEPTMVSERHVHAQVLLAWFDVARESADDEYCDEESVMPVMLPSSQLVSSRVADFDALYSGACHPGGPARWPLPGGLLVIGEEGSGRRNGVCCARDRARRGIR